MVTRLVFTAAVVAALAWTVPPDGRAAQRAAAPVVSLTSAVDLRVAGTSAVVLDRAARTVYRFTIPRPALSSAFRAAPISLARRQVVAAPPQLITPTAIAIDAAGRVYVGDSGAHAIFSIGPDGALARLYSGREIGRAAAIAANDSGRVYVLDDELKRIVSLTADTTEPVIEYSFPDRGEAFAPDRLFWNARALWAVDAHAATVLRLFGINPATQGPSAGPRTLRPGESLSFRRMAPTPAAAVAVGSDALFTLDQTRQRIMAFSVLDGSPLSVDYGWIMRAPSALDVNRDGLYLMNDAATSLVRVPPLVPVTAHFEGGLPTENAVAFYTYLSGRHLLPLRSYELKEGDSIATVVTELNLLPGGFTDTFERFFCQLNSRFCVNQRIPATYRGGRRVMLPDVAPVRYVGRRAQVLPIDPKKDEAIARLKTGRTVEDVSRFYAPITAVNIDSLRTVLADLNYTYKGANLLKERAGTFIIPVDALRVRVLVPRQDLDSPDSELNGLVSKNVRIVPTLESASAASIESPPSSETAGQNPQMPPVVAAKADPLCEDYDAKTYTRVQQLISFCIPKGIDTVSIAIVDNRFYAGHAEFMDRQNHSRLMPLNVDTGNIIRNPRDDETSMNFDENVDHGTHVAGLIAARDAAGEVSGAHPIVRLYAADASKAGELLEITALNIVNISLGRKSGGSQPGPTQEEKVLYSLVADPKYQRILFVIAAGNEGQTVAPGSLASLGVQSNVIVVGASTWSNTPAMFGRSNRGSKFVHIVAPGDAIKSALYGGGYGVASGTSQATAFVSGTAALLRSGVAKSWAPWQIKERILSTADLWLHANGDSQNVFSGMLNMKRALIDADHTVATFEVDGRIVKGAIAARDKEKLIVVKRSGKQPVFFRYADLRRFARNPDGSRSILYSSLPDPNDDQQRVLVRLQDVSATEISSADTGGQLEFTLELPDGTTQTIQLIDLRDFINVVF